MNDKNKSMVVAVNYSIFILVMIINCIRNNENWIYIITLYFILMTFYTISTFFMHHDQGRHKKLGLAEIFVYFIETCTIFLVNRFDSTLISVVLYLFILEDIVINEGIIYGVFSTFILYGVSSISILCKLYYNSSKAVINMLLYLPVYAVVYVIFFLINRLFKQNKIIENSLKDITIKKLEKDNMYDELKSAYDRVEEITALKERNRIAREIHDTVGHTLTTVLVEMEACKRLIDKKPELASEKLDLAEGQVRKGLNSIRASVRVLENGEDIMDFYSDIQSIINETEKHSEVIIKSQIDDSISLSKAQEKVILSALLEGLTNGIRHGKSSAFLFKLYLDGNQIKFSLEDNGEGTDIFVPGFGIRAMMERVKELKGKISIYSKAGEGFGIYINFNIEK
ncbi:sensor histidine kinase [Clostridium hydrogenum]|uniref:sensor histidine kinase n=1 Tax=Clostridium hydrogenum TaxID=2855764 RepID=UPI001F37BAB1|nr:sensor histidine kinase [Clostridium hydrogenum]